jgi:CheY-like chemotaxis protein
MRLADKILGGTKILCVDDSLDVLEFLSVFLIKKGAEITTCISAEEAIAILMKERFDILISDLSMPPGLDGYDLAHALRKMEKENPDRKATPSIMISADALRPSRKRRFADFQVYMPKPFDGTRLVYIVERLAEADAEAVKMGSLAGWEAKQATEAALVATKVAVAATAAATDATLAALNATKSAVKATATASKAEMDAITASISAPPNHS